MSDAFQWSEGNGPRPTRVELAEHRRQLEDEHGPLLGTRFDLEEGRFEEYYADGTTWARRLSAAVAELAFETHH